MTTPQDQAPLRGQVAARLRAAADAVIGAQGRQLPAPVALAIARNGFATAGLASILLNENTVPARDAYLAAEHESRLALSLLDKALGPELVRRYSVGARKADIAEFSQIGAAELQLSTDADIEAIAGAMITLGAALQDILDAVAADDSVPTELRRVAAQARPAAEVVWSHYGGDSGGW